jgi:release factor glutamine methyltransferase
MRTVANARSWAIEELKRVQMTSPSVSADLLLAFVLGWDRVRVLAHPEEPVPDKTWARFEELVLRRTKGEPLQYLTGEREFYGLVLRTGPGALIPRPETEILVEEAIRLMTHGSLPRARFLDIGTGAGCIAIAVAHAIPSATGWAVDLSDRALDMARGNAIRHGVAGRILLIRASLLECFPRHSTFDFIFCNPPYVALKDYDSLPSEVRDYEPHLALFGGESGLEFYQELATELPSRLVPGGYLLLELGAGQADEVRQLIENEGLRVERILDDLQGIPRCLVGRKVSRGPGAIHGQDSRCGRQAAGRTC